MCCAVSKYYLLWNQEHSQQDWVQNNEWDKASRESHSGENQRKSPQSDTKHKAKGQKALRQFVWKSPTKSLIYISRHEWSAFIYA